MPVVGHEFLRGKDEPYWFYVEGMSISGRNFRCKEVFGGRDCFFFLCFGLDMLEKCARSFECLFGISFVRYRSWNRTDLRFIQLIGRPRSNFRCQRGRFWGHVYQRD